MILIDSSVWIDHFRRPNVSLEQLISARAVRVHPLVYGELSTGNLPNREETLRLLRSQARPPVFDSFQVTEFVEAERLYGLGVGIIDVHLLVSARALAGASVWTRDQRLRSVLERFGLAYVEPLQ